MANLTSTTITGTLNTTSTITGPASGASALNASNVSSGTLSSDRLPTVPTTKGGTGLTSIGSAGQVLKVASPGSALEFGDAGGGGNYAMTAFTSPGTWTKDAGLQAVRVTVIGGGGGGGGRDNVFGGGGGGGGGAIEYISAPSIPGPVSVTVGGQASTSSFGAFVSANGGANGGPGQNSSNSNGGPGGNGSGGTINVQGQPGSYANSQLREGEGGDSARGFGTGGRRGNDGSGPSSQNLFAHGYGGGGTSQQVGTQGIVFVEEFY